MSQTRAWATIGASGLSEAMSLSAPLGIASTG